MSMDEISTRELYDQTCIAAQELIDPEYTKGLTTKEAWKSSALCLALLIKNLDEALTLGGEIPHEWVIGDLPEEVPEK